MHVAVVGDGQTIHAKLLDVRHQLGDAVCAVEKRVFAVSMKMHEGHTLCEDNAEQKGCNGR